MKKVNVYWVTDHDDESVTTHHLFTTVPLTNEMKDAEVSKKMEELCPHVRALSSGRFVPHHRLGYVLDAHDFVEKYESKAS
jgi:hypothetical protein